MTTPCRWLPASNRIDMASSFTGLKVLLSWYALETAGRVLLD